MLRHSEYWDTTFNDPIPDGVLRRIFTNRRPIGRHGSCLLLNDRDKHDEATGEYEYWGEFKFPEDEDFIFIFVYFYPEEVLEQ
jgi:hypothetical protein